MTELTVRNQINEFFARAIFYAQEELFEIALGYAKQTLRMIRESKTDTLEACDTGEITIEIEDEHLGKSQEIMIPEFLHEQTLLNALPKEISIQLVEPDQE